MIQGGRRDVGEALVQHPLIKAVGFTGSLKGGRALFDLCAARPEPIPFFGELGSVNPMFILPSALEQRREKIALGWAASLTIGAGQFCTNPGIAVIIEGSGAEDFIAAATAALGKINEQSMLTHGIAEAYRAGVERLQHVQGTKKLIGKESPARTANPYLFQTDSQTWLQNHDLSEEVFGPLGLVVRVRDFDEMLEISKPLRGS